MKKIVQLFDIRFLKFLLVGVINTGFSALIMFLLYNLEGFGYWGSSTTSYILASVLSFFLNKNFTFNNSESIVKTALKFTANVAICYLFAYSISKPLVIWLLSNTSLSNSIVEQLSMLLGMILFTILNYVGQRFFIFKENESEGVLLHYLKK